MRPTHLSSGERRDGRRPSRGLIRGVTAVVIMAVVGVAVAWTWFRAHDNTWAWWSVPPVLEVGGRNYADRGQPVTLQVAKHQGSGSWVRLQDEWPMGWPIWASRVDDHAPTVIYLCTKSESCTLYALQGGP
jgi:hypothetical protein